MARTVIKGEKLPILRGWKELSLGEDIKAVAVGGMEEVAVMWILGVQKLLESVEDVGNKSSTLPEKN